MKLIMKFLIVYFVFVVACNLWFWALVGVGFGPVEDLYDRGLVIKVSPLGLVIYRSQKDIAELFILNDVNINAAGNNKSSYLHWAARKGLKDIAELLILKGANVNAVDVQKTLHCIGLKKRRVGGCGATYLTWGAQIIYIELLIFKVRHLC